MTAIGASQDAALPASTIDLTNCDREPIHIPGAIQPYGVLLAVDERSGMVRVASESAERFLGVPASRIVGTALAAIVGERNAFQLMETAFSAPDRTSERYAIRVKDGSERVFDSLTHRSDGLVVIELTPDEELRKEAAGPQSPLPRRSVVNAMTDAMRGSLATIEQAESLSEMADAIAREMRTLTGFDRVWVYKFHPDWHGEIIGEARRADIETWIGMHYPASDIPAQARALFLRNWVRVIPDVAFVPSPLVPVLNPVTGVPLNLGNSLLRSVSPIHIQYLKNMGVTASLVISLIYRGRLWGLISGHHYSGPRLVSPATRATCEFLAYALSMQVGTADKLENSERALRIKQRQAGIIERLSAAHDIGEALVSAPEMLTELTESDGAAIVRNGRIRTVGRTPSKRDIEELVQWVAAQGTPVVESDALPSVYPPSTAFKDVASGLLAVPISRDRSEQLLWFRGEQRQTVRWAGDPRKPVTIEPGGSARLHPRGSFELWEQEVQGTSCPWQAAEREAAEDLRRALLDVLIVRAEQLEELNAELQVSVEQLQESGLELEEQARTLLEHREMLNDSLQRESHAREDAERANRAKADFLAVMSHELRTPLNAIGGYANLMSLGVRGPTTEAQLADLARIESNQRHLLGLINTILNFAKIEAGAVQYSLGKVSAMAMFESLEPLVSPQLRAKDLEFSIVRCETDLFVRADEEKTRQILINLLTNALKFTPPHGRVEMWCDSDGSTVSMHVRDTGIGIDAASLQKVFEPFVQVDRLAAPTKELGTGLGLSISRELARGMNGDLTAQSEKGVGSTFTLVLPRAH